jgi:fatty-acyl-CoA synthase
MCYTSGTTGRPKGALYSHRSTVLHSMMVAMGNTFALSERDCVLPVVPMFHVNAWGLPFASVLVGAKLMMPGPHLDPESMLEDLEQEEVTFTAGVPTVFLAVLQALDAEPGRYDLSKLRSMVIGGSAAPQGRHRGLREAARDRRRPCVGHDGDEPDRDGSQPAHGGGGAPEDEKLEYRAKQGNPVPFVEIRARGDEGFVPWDGKSLGELEVRGPWVAKRYYNAPEGDDKFTDDGWFTTGDIVTIDEYGFIKITDRTKDLIKSGGEWISSVELENALMAHPAVSQAAVIAIPHEKWDERPLAAIVLKEGESATEEDLRAHLEKDFAKFWLPDAYEFVESIPMTATGKFQKLKLREQFEGYAPATG